MKHNIRLLVFIMMLLAVSVIQAEFRQPPAYPQMVKIPAGEFKMGCVSNSEDCASDEKPVHKVSVPAFYLGRYEVTVREFKAFVDATSYQTEAEKGSGCYGYDDKGNWNERKERHWKKTGIKQNEQHPVVCVSWNDAQAYLDWLSKKTQQTYRLPSEAEWEYAARGQVKQNDKRYWGDDKVLTQACEYANVADKSLAKKWKDKNWSVFDCSDAYVKTSPVGLFIRNDYGLYDMLGNVWEWQADCWHSSYQEAPVNGSVWGKDNEGDCSRGVLRGGSWNYFPEYLRSANRLWFNRANRFFSVGFRVARTF